MPSNIKGGKTISIIIPVFNERLTIAEILKRTINASVLDYKKEIIVVDDGSNDGTEKILENLKEKFHFILLKHSQNLGKGAGIKTGLEQVTGDWVLIQDADLEYNPDDYPKLLGALSEKSPVIYGSRNLEKQKRGYWPYVLGAKFLNFLVNLLFGSKLTDVYTGYKLFPASLIKEISLTSRGFEFEIEITLKVLKKGIVIKEIPIHYYPRKFSEGKKIRCRDGLIGLWTVIKYWLK